MKLIIKSFLALVAIVAGSLILYQNSELLLEKRTFYLMSEELFGMNYGTATLPLVAYFVFCIFLGAIVMSIPALVAVFRGRSARKELAVLRAQMQDAEERSLDDDLAYHVEEDRTEAED